MQPRGAWPNGQRSAADVSSIVPGGSSICSEATLVSCPARITHDHCFLPQTVFLRSNGDRVCAEHLRKDGGDILIGPDGEHVTVLRVEKLPQENRDLVSLTVDTSEGCFQMKVTADHLVMAKGPTGTPVAVIARDLVHERRPVFSGQCFQALVSAEMQPNITTKVVKVTLGTPEQCVLAWLLPEGRRRPRILSANASFCCRGSADTHEDVAKRFLGICVVENTFLDFKPGSGIAGSLRRARSLGAEPLSKGTWSVGTVNHDPSNPSQCRVCPFNRPQLRLCLKGAGCNDCHAPHDEGWAANCSRSPNLAARSSS